jgi:hypothetical protein
MHPQNTAWGSLDLSNSKLGLFALYRASSRIRCTSASLGEMLTAPRRIQVQPALLRIAARAYLWNV